MRRIRFFSRLLRAFIRRHKTLIIVGFLTGILAFWFLPKITPFLPRKREVKKIGLVGRYLLAEIPPLVQSKISFGLTSISEDGTPVPALASSWDFDETGKKYTFFLKKDIFWHNGEKLKAPDVNYNFRDVEVRVENDETIVFKLQETFSPFLTVTSQPIFKKGFIGIGDYQVKKINQKGQVVESIFLHARVEGKPHLFFRFYPTEKTLKTAFKLGEVDLLENLLELDELEDWPGVKITPELKKDRYVALFFNTKDAFLQEKTIRQALAYAITKKEIPERALGPISPSSWAYSGDAKPYQKDIAHAQKLLEQNLEEASLPKKLTISSMTLLLNQAEEIRREWEKLGLEVEVKAFTPEEDFQVLLAIQEIPSDPDQYALWHSTQTGNITKLENPRIDKLLEDGRRVLNQEERKKIYFDFQRFLVEEAPAIFLYYPTTYTLTRS